MHMMEPDQRREELKRHDLAVEKLAKHKQDWAERRTHLADEVSRYRREVHESIGDEVATNKSLGLLRKALRSVEEHDQTEPSIHHYYAPTRKAKQYQIGSTAIAGGAVGLASFGAMKLAGVL